MRRNTPHPIERASVPAAPKQPLPPVTLSLMRQVLTHLALDIEDHQARLVEQGLRGEPSWEKLEQARVLHKTAELLDRVGADKQVMAQLGFKAVSTVKEGPDDGAA